MADFFSGGADIEFELAHENEDVLFQAVDAMKEGYGNIPGVYDIKTRLVWASANSTSRLLQQAKRLDSHPLPSLDNCAAISLAKRSSAFSVVAKS